MNTKSNSIPPMQLGMQQQVGLAQRLIMSAHMQQAIHLLQLPLQELETFIEEQVALNPILEFGEQHTEDEEIDSENETDSIEQDEDEHELSISDKDLTILNRLDEDFRDHFAQSESQIIRSSEEDRLKSYLEQTIYVDPSLREQLLKQAHETFEIERDLEIAEILIGYIDEFGFLNTPLTEICSLHHIDCQSVKEVLREIQTFEPIGVGANNLQESLLIQLRYLKKEKTLAYRLIQDHYEELLHNQLPIIQKGLKCSFEEIHQAIDQDITKLDLHPGSQFSSKPNQPLIPDVTLRQEDDRLIVEVEREYTATLRLNHRYLKMLDDPSTTGETKHYLKHHMFSARWLMRNLQQRYSTLERIAQSLAERQYQFFISPYGQLVPLTMKMLADELNVHESTIARTVSHKYIFSPRGLLPLRSFFTNKYISEEGLDLSSKTVKDALQEIINLEDKRHPLSDEKLSQLLKEKGVSCARRTVAKYRFILEIGNTQQRRKYH